MRIGVVTTSYPRAPGDPAGNFVAAHVRALRELGHDVDVIAAGAATHRSAAPDDWLGHDDAVHRVPDRGAGLFYRGGAPDVLEAAGWRTLVDAAVFSSRMAAAVMSRARRWDSVIAHWLVPSALAALPTRLPLLAIAHGGDVHTLRRTGLLAPTLYALRARGAQLVFVSEALRTIAREAVPRLDRWLASATIQPMGIDAARFAQLGRAPTQPPTIVVAARLVAIKGVDVAIDAFAQVRTRARLVIAGDGPERSTLEARARVRAPHVEFLGMVDAAHRDRLLREASIVVVPSRTLTSGRTEGMPMIALEALATGVPVVASAVGGLAELAPVARLVRPDRPTELAEAIDRTLADPIATGEPDAVAALQRAVSHLDWRNVAGRLVRNP